MFALPAWNRAALRRFLSRAAGISPLLACAWPLVLVPEASRATDQPDTDNRLPMLAAQQREPQLDPLAEEGRQLFKRDWRKTAALNSAAIPPGPVFNGQSCVHCHEQGGVGGAGPVEANVQVLSGKGTWRAVELHHLHAGLLDHTHVVLHKFGTSRSYASWRLHLLTLAEPESKSGMALGVRFASAPRQPTAPVDSAADHADVDILETALATRTNRHSSADTSSSQPGAPPARDPATQKELVLSDRSTTPLFGTGLIDAIPASAIEEAELDEAVRTPNTAGRVSRLANKQVGRFGWHANVASLREFTLTACAVELGLTVPDHARAADPLQLDQRSPGLNLSAEQCDALLSYIAQLPRPIEAKNPHSNVVTRGRKVFGRIGCTDCHRPDLGGVTGLYSDLLLHNMGPDLKGTSYSALLEGRGTLPDDTTPGRTITFQETRMEDLFWRTPPLWGVASSAPYLHDGRAATLSDAIRLHGGQGRLSAKEFSRLSDADETALLTFLGTLVAPPTAEQLPARSKGGWGRASFVGFVDQPPNRQSQANRLRPPSNTGF